MREWTFSYVVVPFSPAVSWIQKFYANLKLRATQKLVEYTPKRNPGITL